MNRTLTVDDSGAMPEIIMRVLRQAGPEAGESLGAGNGAEGIKRPMESSDVALVPGDIHTAQMDGVAFVEGVRMKLIPEDLAGEEY